LTHVSLHNFATYHFCNPTMNYYLVIEPLFCTFAVRKKWLANNWF
jgi:hypothetical protein